MNDGMTALIRWGSCALLALSLGWTAQAFGQAKNPTSLGVYGDWAAYTYKASGGKVCYVVSQPKGSDPKMTKRDPVFLLITHRPTQKVRNEVSTIIGYPFKKDSTVELKVDTNAFQLFTNGDGAWSDTSAKDKEIVGAMRKGKKLSVKGTSWKGTATVDSYSLSGLRDAMKKIDDTCK
jgi:hypothetical protein